MARAWPVPVEAQQPFAEAARETLAVRAAELLRHAEPAARGIDAEALHDLRVACRRLRAALEVYAACFPRKRHARLLKLVKATAAAAGAARDLDVQLAFLEEYLAAAPAPDHPGVQSLVARLRAEREAAQEAVRAAVARLAEEDLAGQAARLAGRPLPASPGTEAA